MKIWIVVLLFVYSSCVFELAQVIFMNSLKARVHFLWEGLLYQVDTLFFEFSITTAMGKRTGLTGLSRFLNAFEDHPAQNLPKLPKNNSSELAQEPLPDEPRPRKKRKTTSAPQKTGLLGPGYEKYDATGLVPYYKHAREVPTHLKKCKKSISASPTKLMLDRLCAAHSTFLSLFLWMSVGHGRCLSFP